MPTDREFFDAVRVAFSDAVQELGLSGPEETKYVIPASAYTGDGLKYKVSLDGFEGNVFCEVEFKTPSVRYRVDLEKLALACSVMDRPGQIRHSARSLKNLKKALPSHAQYVTLVHPALLESDIESSMRNAGAREFREDL